MMTSRTNLIFFIFISYFIANCPVVYASHLQEHTKIWTNAPISGSITQNKKWKYYLEPQLRFVDDAYKFEQANLFAGVYYQWTPDLSFWLGVYRQYEISTSGKTTQQYRLWEQVVWNIVTGNHYSLSSRSRLEERKDFNHAQIANRFRERLTLKIPVYREKKYFIVLADEIFLQLNQPDWVTDRIFSQNRAAIGIEIPVNQSVSYEIGYLNQFTFGSPDQMSHVMYFTLNITAD